MFLEAFSTSTIAVAIGEIGDKTQLLTLLLAARFPRSAWAIIAGIILATLANHGLAVLLGAWGAAWLTPSLLRWIVGLSFIGLAVWALVPDTFDQNALKVKGGAFLATLIAFFIAEMGDKTQVATILLAARYAEASLMVVLGSTLGMVLANLPAIWLGERLMRTMPVAFIRLVAAGIFMALGLLVLIWGAPNL
jgi:putative Ca2+/H+ antiporter (TMEM165/GDT1 family)